jgi:tetratricopeptide (TPR) repeat protein
MSKKVRGKQKQKLRKQKQSDRRTAGESRRSRVARVAPQSANPDRRGTLQQVADLKRHGDWSAARQLMELLANQHPDDVEVLQELMGILEEQNDFSALALLIERLIELCPDESGYRASLILTHIEAGRVALALMKFDEHSRKLPREMRTTIDLMLQEYRTAPQPALKEWHDDPKSALFLAARNEEVRLLLECGQWARAVRVAEPVIQEFPQCVRILNNAAEAYSRLGRIEQAADTARQVLAIDESNVFALGQLCRFQLLSGDSAAVEATVKRLKELPENRPDLWHKRADVFSETGDYQAVWEQWESAERHGVEGPAIQQAGFVHLAAVAACQLGNRNEAIRLWQKSLRLLPGFPPAAENLEDVQRPPGERNGAYARSLTDWIEADTIKGLKDCALEDRDAVRDWLRRTPVFAALVPILIDRGDALGRQLAVRIALVADRPELNEALRLFALGDQGPDVLRLEVASRLKLADVASGEMLRMWVKGQWDDICPLTLTISDEDSVPALLNGAQPLLEAAVDSLHQGTRGAVQAEKLLRQAIELDPNAPSLVQNLAAALMAQNRGDEAEVLIRQNHERHPDYLFAAAVIAQQLVTTGRIDEARQMVRPFLEREVLHSSELGALATFFIKLAVQEKNLKLAEQWLELWSSVRPDDPNLAPIDFLIRSIQTMGKPRAIANALARLIRPGR